jgi:predicted PurR-regulated permease PerM
MTQATPESSKSQQCQLPAGRAALLVLGAASAVIAYVCYLVLCPFLSPLAWALALATVTHPAHIWIERRFPFPNLAAAMTVILTAAVVITPVVFVTHYLAIEVEQKAEFLRRQLLSGEWRKDLQETTVFGRAILWAEAHLVPTSTNHLASPSTDTRQEDPALVEETPTVEQAANLTVGVISLVSNAAWLGLQLLITLMSLFFLLRDRRQVRDSIRALLPISTTEADQVFQRTRDTLNATVFGSLIVALIQGSMGGLMFWWLGLPSPLLWGAIMAVLAFIPVLGTFVVWMPTAVVLAMQGDWGRAAALVLWGAIAIGLIDNLLYPTLVGGRMRFHTLLVFFAVVGGIFQFGAAGVILGPLILVLADALVEIWKRRTGARSELVTSNGAGILRDD